MVAYNQDKIKRKQALLQVSSDILKRYSNRNQLCYQCHKEYGMGALAASINAAEGISKYSYHDNTGEHNAEVKTLLQDGVLLADKYSWQKKFFYSSF